MIHPLPVEPLRIVFSSLSPPNISSHRGTVEENDRPTLLALSLTSKTFRGIVLPILFTLVNIREKDGENSLQSLVNLHRESLALRRTRTAHFDWGNSKGPDYDDELQEVVAKELLVEFSRACTSLDELFLDSTSFCLSPFSGSNLKRLHLYSMILHHDVSDPTIYLPSLDTLILYDAILPSDGFNPSHFPSLRHIAYQGRDDSIDDGELETVVAFKLQLDTLHLRHSPLNCLLRRHPSFPTQIALIGYDLEYLIGYEEEVEDLIEHVCVGVDEHVSTDDVCDVAEMLEDTSRYVKLKSLYLPPFESFLRPKDSWYDPDKAIERLEKVCGDYGIWIVQDSREYHSQVSEEFMKRMTEKRLSKEREAKEGGK